MSTFALELHRLPGGAAVRYAAASVVLSQLAMLLTVGAATFGPLANAIVMPAPVDACRAFELLCRGMLSSIQCPAANATMLACGASGLANFVGVCSCGGPSGFDASPRLAELIIDSQAMANVSASLAPVWPRAGGGQTPGSARLGDLGAWPTDVVDACLS